MRAISGSARRRPFRTGHGSHNSLTRVKHDDDLVERDGTGLIAAWLEHRGILS
jgi:hypothetical protein